MYKETLTSEKKSIKTYTTQLIFETRLEKYIEDCVYVPDGLPCVRCSWPFNSDRKPKILNGILRDKVIKNLANDLYYLNPYNFSAVRKVVLSYNKKYCKISLSLKYIETMLGKIRDRDSIKPSKTKLKYFWTDPKCSNRRSAFAKKYGQIRKEHTQDRIDFFFEEEIDYFDNKLTQKFISKQIGIGVTTLKRYMSPDYIETIKLHNKKFLKR